MQRHPFLAKNTHYRQFLLSTFVLGTFLGVDFFARPILSGPDSNNNDLHGGSTVAKNTRGRSNGVRRAEYGPSSWQFLCTIGMYLCISVCITSREVELGRCPMGSGSLPQIGVRT